MKRVNRVLLILGMLAVPLMGSVQAVGGDFGDIRTRIRFKCLNDLSFYNRVTATCNSLGIYR